MWTKKLISNYLLIVLLQIIATSATFAQAPSDKDGAGSSGGGQTKDGLLRDIVKPPKIIRQLSGLQLITERPSLQLIVKFIRETHYPLGKALESAAYQTMFFFIDAKLNPENDDGFILDSTEYENAMHWTLSHLKRPEVYADNTHFTTVMTQDLHRDFLILHEISRALLPDQSPESKVKLQNFINDMYSFYIAGKKPSSSEVETLVVNYSLKAPSIEDSFPKAAYENNLSALQSMAPQVEGPEVVSEALSSAAVGGHGDVIDYLVSLGADVEYTKRYSYHRTPLQWAAIMGNLEATQRLLAHRANPHKKVGTLTGVSQESLIASLVSCQNINQTRLEIIAALLEGHVYSAEDHAEWAQAAKEFSKFWSKDISKKIFRLIK